MKEPKNKKVNQNIQAIAAATDGACSGNPGPGGWGALIRFDDGSVEEFGGFESQTTNNRMELQAALETLKRLKQVSRQNGMKIKSDSKYLIDGLDKWLEGWKRKGWKTSSGKPVLNQDLWLALDEARLMDVELEYVKGHSGDKDNERVDKIAVSFSKGSDISLRQRFSISSNTKAPLIAQTEQIIEPNLKNLISRLDIAKHLASNSYSLRLKEIAELIEEPVKKLEKNNKAWIWRDWIIEPAGNDLWRLRFLDQSNYQIESPQDE